jgi:hypothetical protein
MDGGKQERRSALGEMAILYDEVPNLWIGIWDHEKGGQVEALTSMTSTTLLSQ